MKKTRFFICSMILSLLWVVSASATDPANHLRVRSHDSNNAPVIAGTPGKVVIAQSSYLFTPSASDQDGDQLSFKISNLPGWASFDPATGRLSGTPGPADLGVYKNIAISVTDGSLVSSTEKFTLEVVASAIYVSPEGNDLSSGRAIDAPFKTVQKAADVALPGDTIFLRAGTYAGAVMRRAGAETGWITLKPFPDEKAIIDGSLNPLKYADFTMYFYHASCDPYSATYTTPCQAAYWVLDGLEIRGGNIYAVKIDQRFVKLLNNDLHGSKNDIVKLVKTADDVSIIGNEIHDNNAVAGTNAQAIDIVGADRAYVANNHIYNIPSVGMFAKGNARNAIFEYNVLENIYDRGIMLGQSTDATSLIDGPYECYDCIARNNIVSNAGVGCFGVSSAKNAMVYNNTCYMAAATGQAAIYLSKESEIGTRSCQVDIRNNIIHVAAGTKRPAIKVGYLGMHSGVATASDPAERCPDGYKTLTIDNNVYWNESNNAADVTFLWADIGLYNLADITKWRLKTGLDTKSKIANPQFVDPGRKNFDIKAGSPAVDAGVALPQVSNDFGLQARPQGQGYDVGAFEH